MTISPFDTDILGTGTRLQPGIGQAYPELKRVMQVFFANRVAKLPWLPSNWLEAVKQIQADAPDDLVLIARKNWGDSDAWNAIAQDSEDIQAKYAAGQVQEGRDLLASIDAEAAFWNAAYHVDVVAASPIQIAKGGANVLGNLAGSIIDNTFKGLTGALSSTTKTILIVAAAGVVLYFTAPLLRTLVKKG